MSVKKYSKHRRSQLEIVRDILIAVRTQALPTRIMYAANLSWKPVQGHLKNLVEKGWVECNESSAGDKRTNKIYKLTPEGEKTIVHLVRMLKEVTF